MSVSYLIEQWCDTACSYIRFKPDRAGVKRELLWHFEDKCGELAGAGLSEYEAAKKAAADMGPPEETGRLLRATHKPYLGWLWVTSRWILILSVVAMLLAIPGVGNRISIYSHTLTSNERAYTQTSSESGKRTLYIEPGCSAQSELHP